MENCKEDKKRIHDESHDVREGSKRECHCGNIFYPTTIFYLNTIKLEIIIKSCQEPDLGIRIFWLINAIYFVAETEDQQIILN
jgi:hypothetical protein